MVELYVFHFNDNEKNFEDFAVENGNRYWYASELMAMLGYDTLSAFNNAINRAIQACMALGIPIIENFIQFTNIIGGKKVDDYKLTRFACFLTAMNGDPRKPQVAEAQAYFAALAETVKHLHEVEDVERMLVREEISEREKSLVGVAKQAGITQYAFFQNAGYLGMYNMNLKQLRQRRNIPEGVTPLDYMGKTELAGNLFRITQTEAKIKNERIYGQPRLESAAKEVGQKVRKTMIEISGVPPELLPVKEDIKEVRKTLKRSHKELKELDSPKNKKKLKP